MKNLAELKRVGIGTRFMLTYTKYPWKNGIKTPIPRTVERVQSNALVFTPEPGYGIINSSYLSFPKKSEFIGTENGFKILDETGDTLLEYELCK